MAHRPGRLRTTNVRESEATDNGRRPPPVRIGVPCSVGGVKASSNRSQTFGTGRYSIADFLGKDRSKSEGTAATVSSILPSRTKVDTMEGRFGKNSGELAKTASRPVDVEVRLGPGTWDLEPGTWDRSLAIEPAPHSSANHGWTKLSCLGASGASRSIGGTETARAPEERGDDDG